jgi:hypothetical protein
MFAVPGVAEQLDAAVATLRTIRLGNSNRLNRMRHLLPGSTAIGGAKLAFAISS